MKTLFIPINDHSAWWNNNLHDTGNEQWNWEALVMA